MSDDGEAGMIGGSATTELASSRTGLALERSMMGADRTLMAIVRTALSLIGFGFTINQVFRQLAAKGLLIGAERTGRRLGAALLALGVLLLVMGLIGHVRFYRNLKQRRRRLLELGLLHGVDHYRATPTLITAALLLALGLVTLLSLMFRIHWW
jgi:putative membrane protein